MSSPHPFLPGAELEPGLPLPDSVAIDISRPPVSANEDGTLFNELGNGDVEIDEHPGETEHDPALGDPNEHDANLAEFVDASTLGTIASDVLEWVEVDLRSREKWYQRLADGLRLLGVSIPDGATGPMKDVEKVNHPMIAEAQVQFQARAIAELVPPTGPAKGMVLGDRTVELDEQAERVADYENYQLMVEDGDYYPETDRMLFVLSGEGSQFKKVYRETLLDRNVSRWVRAEDFIVPYGAVSLETVPRYTHQIAVQRNDMKKLQAGGFYRDIPLVDPTEGKSTTPLQQKRDEGQGQENQQDLVDDTPHTVFETTCYLDVKGFEDKGPDGEPTGIALPYRVSVDKESRATLAIRREWKENDPKRRKRIRWVHFPMFPGDGFYSYGFYHLIGGLGHAATGLLKTIMIGAAFASMQGGFKTKSGAKVDSSIELEYGVYKDVDATYEEISRAFYTPPFKEPGEALFKTLGILEEAAQRFASTTESMVGDASNTGPVGTTVALIEQGSKVYTGIHKRLHYAQGQELKLLAELTAEHLPEAGYPYAVHGKSREILKTDFDDRVDVVPVSDPNIFSSTQRIAIAQMVIQRTAEVPDLYDRMAAEKRLLEAARVPDPDALLAKKTRPTRADPVTENAMMMVGKPAKVYPDQDHDSHIAVVQSMIDGLSTRPQGDPIAQRVLPVAYAHLAEHMAVGTRVKMMQAMGIPLPPMNLDAEGEEPITPPMPPEVENAIAQRAAAMIAQMPKPQQPGDAQAKPMQDQAKALQQQAQQLAQDRDALQKQQTGAEKASMKAAYDIKVAALTSQMATLRTEMAQMKAGASTQALLDEAVNRVEQAIEGLTAGQPAA